LTETSCLEVIIIKLSPKFRRIRAYVFRYPNIDEPVQCLRFKRGECTALGQQVIDISLASLFAAENLVPADLNVKFPTGFLPLDLFPMIEALNRAC